MKDPRDQRPSLPQHHHDRRHRRGTSALIAQLALQDITEISGTHKGKGRSDAVKTDEEHAFDLQADYWRTELDLQLAQSLNRALETDANWLAVAQAAEDDHRYALALRDGAALPTQSANQRLMEDPAFMRTLMAAPPDAAICADVVERDLVPTTGTSTATTPLSTRPPSPSTSSQCVICGDRLRAQRSFRAPCGDQYCHGCLRDLVQASINDESLYPVRCCGPTSCRERFSTTPFLRFTITFPNQVQRARNAGHGACLLPESYLLGFPWFFRGKQWRHGVYSVRDGRLPFVASRMHIGERTASRTLRFKTCTR